MAVAWDAMVVVGTIARPHGLRGEVVVNPETDFPDERFGIGSLLHARPHGEPVTLRVRSVRFHRGRPIIGFEGVGSIEEAEALGRGELRVEAGVPGTLPEGVFFHHELVDCRVETADGRDLGLVVRIAGGGGASLLVVNGAGREYLIPLAADICVEIDPAAKRIVVEPPEGLLDLNA
jgi:16S rRNA processing protein RimM